MKLNLSRNEIKHLIKKHKILKKANVNGYSGKLRQRIRNGKEMPGTRVFRVYVSKKKPLSVLSRKDIIPSSLQLGSDKIEVDVVEIGDIKYINTTPEDHQKRYRPYMGGVSCTNQFSTACTLNYFFKRKIKDGVGGPIYQVLISSCNHCLPEGSKIASNPRMVPIESADSCLNMKGENQSVLEHFSREYNGPLVVIKPRFLSEVKLTPEHPVLVVKPIKTYSYPYRSYPKYSKPLGNKIDTKQLKPEWKYAKDIEKFDLLLVPKIQRKISESNLDEKFLYFLGWYLAEGSVSPTDGSRNPCTVKIGISDRNKRDYLYNIISEYYHATIDEESREEGSLYNLKIYSVSLADQLKKWFGVGAETKRLPGFIFTLSDDKLNAFIRGYVDGDGFENDQYYCVSTASSSLKDDLIMLFLSLGKVPSVWYQEQSKEYKGYKWTSRVWTIAVWKGKSKDYFEDKDYFYLPVRDVFLEPYSGKVFNLKTEDSVYCIPFIVHNCFGRENDAKPGEKILQPSPYDSGSVENDVIGEFLFGIETKYSSFTCGIRNFFHKIYKGITRREAVNRVDIAFGVPSNASDISYEIFGIDGRITGKGDHEYRSTVYKSGRTSGVTELKIIDDDWNGKVQGRRGIAEYEDCVLCAGECAGGDSGSPVLKKDGTGNLLYCGSLFAGGDNTMVYCKVENIESEAGVKLVIY